MFYRVEQISKELFDNGWDFSIRFNRVGVEIVVYKHDWPTDDLYKAKVCPSGKGANMQYAYANLKQSIIAEGYQ